MPSRSKAWCRETAATCRKLSARFRNGLQLAHALRYSRAEGWILHESGLNQSDQGNREAALQRLEEALAVFRHLSIRPLIERTERALTLIR